MQERYDAPEDEIAADVREFISTLDSYGVLEK